ncbi:MAG: methyltransferase domain-containing protein [Clostridia bacterium]|nr:methyltransferase domain-containing protein [Clostridia bacterium]
MSSNQIDVEFAKSWDLSHGHFSKGIAERILEFANENKIKIKTALDICCGASNLLDVFNNHGIKCAGTETRQGMIDYSKEKYPDINFYLTKNMYDVPPKAKADLITCNHDIVNYFENFDEWKLFFKSVSKNLSGHGMFVFDFYTKYKLKDWKETTFSTSEWLDCLTQVKPGVYDKTIITYTYFINCGDHLVKTKDIVAESYYETNLVLDELKKAGFKKIMIVDERLNPIEQNDYIERMHIVALKK